MFVMLYNNFVNPAHLIYCYQRINGVTVVSDLFLFEDLALNHV